MEDESGRRAAAPLTIKEHLLSLILWPRLDPLGSKTTLWFQNIILPVRWPAISSTQAFIRNPLKGPVCAQCCY